MPQEKRIPVWEPNREPSTSHRSRPVENPVNSHYPEPKRRYQEPDFKEERRYDEERPPHFQNKFEKYPNNRYDNYNRFENQGYDNRWKEDNYVPGRRRPYGHRGGYRGHGFRHPDYHNPSQDYDRDSQDPNSRSKVKLVDY